MHALPCDICIYCVCACVYIYHYKKWFVLPSFDQGKLELYILFKNGKFVFKFTSMVNNQNNHE